MAAGDILGVGVSGLLAFQRELATTGHNISNINTPGYSRQRVDLTTQIPQSAGNIFIGTGVQVTGIQRVYSEFLTSQLRSASSANSQLQTYYQSSSQIDNMLADPIAGLTPSLQGFFNAAHTVSNDPTSTTARQVMLSAANTLADRFHYMNQRMSDLRQGVNTQIKSTLNEINSIATGIASINTEIVRAAGINSGQAPNDLLDKRDALMAQLAQRVSVTAVPQDDGALNVFIGNGLTLVAGNTATSLSAVNNPYDPTRTEIGYTVSGITTIISDYVTGGTLGGALDFRNQVLDTTQNAMGRLALGLTDTFNDQHRLGADLSGNINLDFFSAILPTSPKVLLNVNNGGTGLVAASINDATVLTTSDYRLDRGAGGYTLTRLSDNNVTTLAVFPGGSETVDGVTLSLTSGAIAIGDSFLIQPTRRGANDSGVAIGDPARIAAAAPVIAGATTNVNGLPTNLGTGKISSGTVSNTTNLPLAGNITLTFNSTLNQFAVVGGPGGTLAYNPATEGGGKQFSFPTYGGFGFTISGTPANGDSFVIRNNTGGVSDNRNALALADLRTQLVLGNGSASYEDFYGQLLTDVGTNTRRADINRGAQQSLLNQVSEARDAVSGVNLDEEAANLVRFQQAYQAAAQVIAVSDVLFQTLLGAVRR